MKIAHLGGGGVVLVGVGIFIKIKFYWVEGRKKFRVNSQGPSNSSEYGRVDVGEKCQKNFKLLVSVSI